MQEPSPSAASVSALAAPAPWFGLHPAGPTTRTGRAAALSCLGRLCSVVVLAILASSHVHRVWRQYPEWLPTSSRNATASITLDSASIHAHTGLVQESHHPNDGFQRESVSSSVLGDAYDEQGRAGYVADPTALRRERQRFRHARTREASESGATEPSIEDSSDYWHILENFVPFRADQDPLLNSRNHPLRANVSSDYVCAFPPGRGLEEEGGYKLLTEKIRLQTVHRRNTTTTPRLLCAVYTYPRMRDLARASALSWGYQCDGFLAFTTETIPSLGFVHLSHAGKESYRNMWQKTRSIWSYIARHYADDYDYFHLGGDDMYVLVPNLRAFWQDEIIPDRMGTGSGAGQDQAIFTGQQVVLREGQRPYVSGGPGYTMNRAALHRLVNEALPECEVDTIASHEDRLVSQCFDRIGIKPWDSRDVPTGSQRYHDCSPHHLYTFRAVTSSGRGRGSFHARAAAYWASQPRLGSMVGTNETTGPRYGLAAAATHSISFHDVHNPLYVARMYALLYPGSCPSATALGRGLAQSHGHRAAGF